MIESGVGLTQEEIKLERDALKHMCMKSQIGRAHV